MSDAKISAEIVRRMKGQQRIPCLTVYDFPMTKMLDEMGVPLLLVGDSLGMVVLGYPDTTCVTMADMEHHLRAAARARPRALLVADLPYRSCDTPESAVENAQRLVSAGAEAVKAEGGQQILKQVEAIIAAGIPFLGHLGMLPQSVREEGRYRIKGKVPAERDALLEDAKALEQAGAFGIVLELVTPTVAKTITDHIKIPSIGIGSGSECDGQILVTHDLIGTFPWFTPKFVKPRLNSAEQIRGAVQDWMREVRAGR